MSDGYYEFFCPVKVLAGHKALEHIPFELGALSASRPLIITDQGVLGAGLIKHIEQAMEQAGNTIGGLFADVPPDSSVETVAKAAQYFRDNNCDSIIAVGGGSVIDTSKCVNVLVTEGGDDIRAYAGAHSIKTPLKPFFIVPTTSGTGSETTLVAVIYDQENEVKVPFTSYFLMPNAAILDSRMTLTLPPHITAMTAMDAMTHAIEAFTCLAHNPLSDAYASIAIRLISENILKVMDNPKDVDGRLALAQAATMAGAAFSNSMVGLVHTLGHALGAAVHLPHGLCMNLFLPYALEYNQDVNGDRIAELLLPLAGADIYANTPADQRVDKVISHIRWLRDELYQRCQLPRTLVETNKVKREDLATVVELAIDDGSIVYNPKEANRDELMAVLERAWD